VSDVVHRLVNDPLADTVFVSSDNVLFLIHREHLDFATAGFAVPPLISSDDSPVKLTEPSEILQILFQFIEPCSEKVQYRQPSVMTMKPEIFFAVAEAAEKYIVSGAMNTCITRMKWALLFYRPSNRCNRTFFSHTEIYNSHPIEVLNHCAKHGYADLAGTAAHESLSFPLDKIVQGLTHPGLLGKWVRLVPLTVNVFFT
jgi:hypothetical protein